MHTIIPTLAPVPAPRSALPATRQPHYECHDTPHALQLLVLVPGVEAGGLEITTSGPDLFITARKARYVRPNWPALHLESVQRDYHLALRLGHGVDFTQLHAELRDGLLTLTVPKRAAGTPRERRVA